ncbi:MAG: DUF192 domain-containing protein [Acidimicrobiales bacterium]
MPWLVADGRVLASVEIAEAYRTRAKGLLGRNGIDGALLLRPARSVHSFGMRFPIDVAFCDADLYVLDIIDLRPHRMTLPRWRARAVIEAEAGAFDRWGVRVGDQVEVRS